VAFGGGQEQPMGKAGQAENRQDVNLSVRQRNGVYSRTSRRSTRQEPQEPGQTDTRLPK